MTNNSVGEGVHVQRTIHRLKKFKVIRKDMPLILHGSAVNFGQSVF